MEILHEQNEHPERPRSADGGLLHGEERGHPHGQQGRRVHGHGAGGRWRRVRGQDLELRPLHGHVRARGHREGPGHRHHLEGFRAAEDRAHPPGQRVRRRGHVQDRPLLAPGPQCRIRDIVAGDRGVPGSGPEAPGPVPDEGTQGGDALLSRRGEAAPRHPGGISGAHPEHRVPGQGRGRPVSAAGRGADRGRGDPPRSREADGAGHREAGRGLRLHRRGAAAGAHQHRHGRGPCRRGAFAGPRGDRRPHRAHAPFPPRAAGVRLAQAPHVPGGGGALHPGSAGRAAL